jgi:urease accessory protein
VTSDGPGRRFPGTELVALLQLVDSGFPSGAYTLSHGLESLVADGLVPHADALVEVLGTQLRSRLAYADLPATAGATDADLERVVAIDRALSASKLATEERRGSTRVGRRIVDEVSRLVADGRLAAFAGAIDAGRTPGTSAVAFGLAASAMGVGARDAVIGAASTFVLGQAAAAVRLGLVGHREAQLAIRRSAPAIADSIEVALGRDPLDPRPCAPGIDIAMARHETASVRMFAS